MTQIEEKYNSSKKLTLDLRSVITSPIFRYIPRSRRRKGQPPFIEDRSKVQPWRLENRNLHVLKEDVIIPLPNLQLISKDETQKSVKSLENQTEQEFFPSKRINEGFNPKAYKLLSMTGYDFTASSWLGELRLETTGEKMYDLNGTRKKLKQQGYTVKPSRVGLGFVLFEPIKISVKTKKTKASTQHITVDDMEEIVGRILILEFQCLIGLRL